MSTTDESAETPAQALFGNRFLTEPAPAPARHFPERQQVKQGSGY